MWLSLELEALGAEQRFAFCTCVQEHRGHVKAASLRWDMQCSGCTSADIWGPCWQRGTQPRLGCVRVRGVCACVCVCALLHGGCSSTPCCNRCKKTKHELISFFNLLQQRMELPRCGVDCSTVKELPEECSALPTLVSVTSGKRPLEREQPARQETGLSFIFVLVSTWMSLFQSVSVCNCLIWKPLVDTYISAIGWELLVTRQDKHLEGHYKLTCLRVKWWEGKRNIPQ